MKTITQLTAALEALTGRHYYSEDFELISAYQEFIAGLSREERLLMADLLVNRLRGEASLVDILLCSVVEVPAAALLLAERLNREPQTNQVTRALITALSRCSSDEAYRAVERFLDSDQEMEALQALARIDFIRALPDLARRMDTPPSQGVALHILHAYAKQHGLDALIRVLQESSVARSDTFRLRLVATLNVKADNYNPFTPDERQRLASA